MILGLRSVTRRRFASGSRGSDGRWTKGAATDTSISMGVQPLSDRELQRLPEGERQSQQLKGYTAADVRTVDDRASPQVDADQIIVDSVVYEVRDVVEQTSLLPHKRVRLLRLLESDA